MITGMSMRKIRDGMRVVPRTVSLAVFVLVSAAMILLPLTASAVPVGAGDLTGSRSTPSTSGVVAADGWTEANGGFKISWTISSIVGGWHYSYTLSNADGSVPLNPNPSHLILEVSDNFTSNDVSNAFPSVTGPQTFSPGPSNPDMPGSIFGIKLDFFEGSSAVAFDSTRAPMWGDFYVKDGKHNDIWATAWNTGFGSECAAAPCTNWVPVPDTQTVVPEPATLLLLGSGLMGMGWFGRKRLNKDRER